jgi:hypothetical protein
MSTELEAKVAELTAQLAAVRADLDGILAVFNLRSVGAQKDPTSLIPCCRALNIRSPKYKSEIDLMAHDDKAYISMRPSGNRNTIIIKAEGEDATISLLTPEGKQEIILHRGSAGAGITVGDEKTPRAAQMWVQDGRGHLALWAGDPHPAIALRNDPKCVEVLVTHPNGKHAARLTDSENGGRLMLYHADGSPSFNVLNARDNSHLRMQPAGVKEFTASMSSGQGGDGEDVGGSIYLSMPGGILQASVITTQEGGAVILGDATSQSTVHLSTLSGAGSLSLSSAEGKNQVCLTVHKDCGSLTLSDSSDRERIVLTADTTAPSLVLKDGSNVETIALRAADEGCFIHLVAPEGEHSILLTAVEGQGSLQFGTAIDEPLIVLSVQPDSGACLILSGPDHAPHAQLKSGPGGGFVQLNDELGLERIRLCTVSDAGAVATRWAGQPSIVFSGNERGGFIIPYDSEGKARTVWPEADGE